MSIVKAKIERIVEAARDSIVDLAKEYRTDVLLPLCRKHKLTYLAGNGTYFFFVKGDSEKSISNIDDAKVFGYGKILGEVFEDLDAEGLDGNDRFGYYIVDITRKDIRL